MRIFPPGSSRWFALFIELMHHVGCSAWLQSFSSLRQYSAGADVVDCLTVCSTEASDHGRPSVGHSFGSNSFGVR